MENIGSSNVYIKLPELTRVNVDYGLSSSTKGDKIRRTLPHWTRLSLTNSDDDDDNNDDDDDQKSKYADWTLDVTVTSINHDDDDDDDDNNASSDEIVISYLVHKYSLGLQSEYFESIFRCCCNSANDDNVGGGFSESYQKRSAIQLPASGVVTLDHFEILLDYLYTNKLVLDLNNAIAMVYFGDYFGINLLHDQAQSFIRESITSEINSTGTTAESLEMKKLLLAAFYKDAKVLAMEELQEAIVYECAGNPRLIMPKNDIAIYLVPMDGDKQFWCRVLDARKFHLPTERSSKLWSINVGHFIRLHYSNIVDRERFYELTCKNSLPSVSAYVAIFLIEQEQQMFAEAENEEITPKKDDDKNHTSFPKRMIGSPIDSNTSKQMLATINDKTAQTKDDDKHLTCLQRRCIDALIDTDTGSWKVPKPRTLQGRLRHLPPCVLESLLLCTMVERKKPPIQNTNCIRVSGAGSEVVNGIYYQSAIILGCPMFTRVAQYDDDDDDVEVSICKSTNGHFYIGCRDEDVDFYYSTNRDLEATHFSPDMRWESCEEGEEPLPTFQFV